MPSVLIDSIVHNAEGTRPVPFLGKLFRYDPQLSYFHFARRRFFLLLLLCRACEFLSAAPASAYWKPDRTPYARTPEASLLFAKLICCSRHRSWRIRY